MSVQLLTPREGDTVVSELADDALRTETLPVAEPEESKTHEHRCGYGRCSICNCPAYSGTSYICDNCGHNYASHW